VIDEILLENIYRNPEGNPVILDSLLLEKVADEERITLLLNTAVDSVDMGSGHVIQSVSAYCSQNETRYSLSAPLFCDASGDGIVGYLSGAAYRMGSESSGEFAEPLAPPDSRDDLLGDSMYFYSKDTGRPVRYVAPRFALKDITEIPHFRRFRASDSGCELWWLEYGGRLDTVYDTEEIKWELWRVIFGVWDYIKNSGLFPEAATLTLEWVGVVPGKRESRRFEGDYILTQADVFEQRSHWDAVSVGGWAVDLHPADGVYSPLPSCTQWHAPGVYQIPYRCLYSRNVANLFLTGRLISVSHVAFGSTRVMATCAQNGQAVGMAAALCNKWGQRPRDLSEAGRMRQLQDELLAAGQYIPGLSLGDPGDLALSGEVAASSRLVLGEFRGCGEFAGLDVARAMLIPVEAGNVPRIGVRVGTESATTLVAELRGSSVVGNFTPDRLLGRAEVSLDGPGRSVKWFDFHAAVETPQYVFVCLMPALGVSVELTDQRVTGVLSLSQRMERSVARAAVQEAFPEAGVPRVEFWLPERRPGGRNWALMISPGLDVFGPSNAVNGLRRPACGPNAWVADPEDPAPTLTLRWPSPTSIGRVVVTLDTDLDHPLESVLRGHPEREMPSCVRGYRLRDDMGRVLYECSDNHLTRNSVSFSRPVTTSALSMEVTETRGWPASVFEVRCY
jgi:hypothetical protein